MTKAAPALGWSMLLTGAAAVAACSFGVQLAFAVAAIGVVGMAHGASDLAIVPHRRRAAFLAAYALVGGLCLWWWVADPALALPAFLIASAVHFGLEDAPHGGVVERVARGTSLVATPATLHMASLGDILRLGGSSATVPTMIAVMAIAGGAAAAWLLACALRRRDLRLLAGTVALALLPPLVGFSVGFLILHAIPQTLERRDQLGCATMTAYLRATAPILAVALVLLALVGWVMLRWDSSGVRPLFAGLAALAIPHLLVTPLFERRPAAFRLPGPHGVGRPTPA